MKSNFSDGYILLTLSFSNLELSGNILIEKSTLGIKEVSVAISKEKFMLQIDQPFIPLPPFLQKISAKITMNMIRTFDTPLSLLTFPLNTGTTWFFNSSNSTINGKIQSNWLYLLNFFNKIAKLFGHEFIPAKFSELLPIIDINQAITALDSENVFKFPVNDSMMFCTNTENITVPAGSYNAYTITFLEGQAQCYYAPMAGNVIKISGNLEQLIHGLTNFKMELLSTNYS